VDICPQFSQIGMKNGSFQLQQIPFLASKGSPQLQFLPTPLLNNLLGCRFIMLITTFEYGVIIPGHLLLLKKNST